MPVIESARATHTTLETANVPRAMRFYKEVLGLRTHQVLEKAGHLIDTRGVYAAYIELPKLAPQPFLNFYARPVAEPRGSIVPAGPISYVTLECRDVEKSMRFYGEFLGLDAERRGPRFFF